MKKFSQKIAKLRAADAKKERMSDQPMIELLKKVMGLPDSADNPELIMSSNEFIEYWQKHVETIAVFKEDSKKKRSFRDTSYSSIGIQDKNDVIQEAYLAFMKSWNNVDWKKINEADEMDKDRMLWGYLKNSTALYLNRQLRNQKDGMRITNHGLFDSKESKEKNKNVKAITSLFSRLDKVLLNNEDDLSVSSYETDLVGYMLDDIMDEFLDLDRYGNRFKRGIERRVLKSLLGLDEVQKTYAELEDEFKVSRSTLENVKSRAMKKLKQPEVMKRISEFMNEYKIETNSNARNY